MPTATRSLLAAASLAALAAACQPHAAPSTTAAATPAPAPAGPVAVKAYAPDADNARARLEASPRHREWVMIPTGGADSVGAWVVYPERSDKAPVVVVVHEIFGLGTWIESIADQLAAEGYIAIAPDLLTGKHKPAPADSISVDSAIVMIRQLDPAEVDRQLSAVARYGMALPAALPRYGIIGFCWGGSTVFQYTTQAPDLSAAVVYYGAAPRPERVASIHAPVLGLYGGKDARVDATIPPADSAMRALGKTFDPHVFPGAGHGFLRAQDGQAGANLAASREAWPLTIGWFRRYLGS